MTNYIVILNYNSWSDTIECIESVINSSYKDISIIVLDKSTNNSENQIKSFLNGNLQVSIDDEFYTSKLAQRHLELLILFMI